MDNIKSKRVLREALIEKMESELFYEIEPEIALIKSWILLVFRCCQINLNVPVYESLLEQENVLQYIYNLCEDEIEENLDKTRGYYIKTLAYTIRQHLKEN